MRRRKYEITKTTMAHMPAGEGQGGGGGRSGGGGGQERQRKGMRCGEKNAVPLGRKDVEIKDDQWK